MQDVHQLKETIRAILGSQGLAVLATQGDRGPYGSLVAFAATADLKGLVFATTRATRKYANLVRNTGVALVIDTRTNQTADFADAAAVTARWNRTAGCLIARAAGSFPMLPLPGRTVSSPKSGAWQPDRYPPR